MCIVGPMTQFASLNNLHPEGLEMFHVVIRPCSGLCTGEWGIKPVGVP